MDEDDAKPPLPDWPPKSIDHLSIEALGRYRKALEAEIERVQRTLDARNRHRSAADSLFKR